MPRTISVIIHVERGGGWLGRLVRSLDAQSVPYDDFEAVFALATPDQAVARRLGDLAARRPNMRVVDYSPDSSEPDTAANSSWTVDLGRALHIGKPALTPDALGRLVAFGERHGCGAVLGRSADRAGLLIDDRFAADRAQDETGTDPTGSAVVATRREPGHDGVAVLGGGPVLIVDALPSPEQCCSVRVTDSSVHWADGRLVIEVAGDVTDAASAAEVSFALRSPGSGVEYWVASRTLAPIEDHFRGTAEVDVRTVAAGTPLPIGLWQVTVGVHGAGAGWSLRSPVPPMTVPPGIVDGVLVVPMDVDATLSLDVGARRSSPVGTVDARSVTIDDSARGTKLTAVVPDLVVDGAARVSGAVLLDDFRFPAKLVAEGGHARVEAYVSGLAGSSVLSTQFGLGRPVTSGLSLTISPVGAVDVERHVPAPPAPPKAAAPQPTVPKRSVAVPAPGKAATIARLRRRVPRRLEPAAAALSRNRFARKVYRALATGRR